MSCTPVIEISGETNITLVDGDDNLNTVSGNEYQTVVTGENEVVAVSYETYVLTAYGGLPGKDGEVAGLPQYEAGETLSALKPIAIIAGKAYTASNLNPLHLNRVVGISLTSVSVGEQVTVAVDGSKVEDALWNWTNRTLFVGSGVLTQTPPVSGFLQKVAAVTSNTSVQVLVGEPTER